MDAADQNQFELNEDQLAIQDMARAFASDRVAPYALQWDREKHFPVDILQETGPLGMGGIYVREDVGGSALKRLDAVLIFEALATACPSFSAFVSIHNMAAWMIDTYGNDEQRQRFLPKLTSMESLASYCLTEPGSGSDAAALRTRATRDGDHYIVNGQKVFISRAEHSDLMILLVRTTPKDQCVKKSEGLSVLIVDLNEAVGNGLEIRPIKTMMNHATTELFIDNLKVPVENLIGEEGKGFRYILDGMNAERILIAAECIGDGRWFIERATNYAKERVVFDRPIGQNQGIQFPIAQAHIHIEAADLMRIKAAELYDRQQACGAEANMAKLLAADASWEAANVAIQTYGGFGFAAEYDIERKFKETRLYQVAPISTNLILSYVGEHILKLPKSY